MQTNEEVRAEVEKAVNGDGAAPQAAETPESPAEGVKPEQQPEAKPVEQQPAQQPADEPVKDVDPAKLMEQVNNLNAALKGERSEKQQDKQKIADLEKKLEELNGNLSVIDKIRGAFEPPKEPEPQQPPRYLTPEEAEELWQQREEAKEQELLKEKQTMAIKAEIEELEKAWDGKDGKPQYNDQEVLDWQQKNNKLYLSPTEAFNLMRKNEILDWEVKQRLNGRGPTPDVERPSGIQGDHNPTEKIPTDDAGLRNAIIEAMENAEKGI
jgi:hypothetical protein